MMNPNQNSDSVEATATTIVNGNEQSLTEKYISTNSDESAILVENGGNATISNAVIDKSSGNSTNTENSEFYGVNAGILVKSNSTATIKNAIISTNAKGSNAVFSTGTDSKIYISDSTITTEGESSSRGLEATYGGYIEADNVKISTKGGSCAALATDRGEGTIIAKNSNFETNGAGSPVIYSTGNISITDSSGSNGGNVTLNAVNQVMEGNIELDNISTLKMNLSDNSSYEGTINSENTAKNISLKIDNSSKIKLTGDFYVTSLEDEDANYNNIDFNGFRLYVNGVAIN